MAVPRLIDMFPRGLMPAQTHKVELLSPASGGTDTANYKPFYAS